MGIEFLITGGTIDKTYNPLNGELHFTHSYVPAMLQRSRHTANINTHELFLLDSLEMQDCHRQEIVEHCNNSDSDKILISHGTDTMQNTADALMQAAANKTIILLGAMIPYSVEGSDALFNLGFALSAVQLLPPGCYICMNGEVFAAGFVDKNRELGCFVSREPTLDAA